MRIRVFLILILSFFFAPFSMAQIDAKLLAYFKSIPILHEGRVKPLDTYARNLLLRISGRDHYEKTSAVGWFAQLLLAHQKTVDDKVFLINDPDIAVSLNINIEEHRRYSWEELKDAYPKLMELENAVFNIDADKRSLTENEMIRVAQNLEIYVAIASFGARQRIAGGSDWISPWEMISHDFSDKAKNKLAKIWDSMARAYTRGDSTQFNTLAKLYGDTIKDNLGANELKAARKFPLELAYNAAMPFVWAKVFYILAFIFFLISFVSSRKCWYWFGFLSIIAGFMPHIWGLVARILIMERPPVTDLYETFIFVGVITVLLGLGIEYFNRRWLGIVTAAICGAILLFIAGRYSSEGDTLKMLAAVLNSNFWLGTHVITITMGYGASLVAGILGHVWLLQAALGKKREVLDNTYKITLGIMGVALTLTFLGTNLGGIWADQSWGRFWGWDPKENGALMIVLWLALLFHAKFAKMISSLGLAIGCVMGMMVVMWAWFGVNLLNIGLHSYGFTSGVADALIIYVVCEIIFVVLMIFMIRPKAYQ